MKYIFTFIFVLISCTIFCQDNDTIIFYNQQEIELLNSRVLELERKLSINDSTNQLKKSSLLENSRLSFFGILRLGEIDWNQKMINPSNGNVEKLHSRFWTRALLYFNLDTKFNEQFSFRTSIFTHPYYAFGDNNDSKLNILLNEFWLDYKLKENYTFRLGRQNASRVWNDQIGELFDFWNLDGLSFKANNKVNKIDINTKLGYFMANYVDNASLKEQGKIYGFDIDLNYDNEVNNFKITTGLLKAEKLPNQHFSNIGNYFYPGDLAPNYSIWKNQIQVKLKQLNNLTFNGNLYYNLQNYKENPPSNLITDKSGHNSFSKNVLGESIFNKNETPNFTNQKFGFYLSSSMKFPVAKKDFYLKLAYLYLEKYAVLDYFAQYDLARWASTNIQGPEIMFSYKINKWMRISNRNFFMKEIKGLNGVDENFRRKGNRSRLDLIIDF